MTVLITAFQMKQQRLFKTYPELLLFSSYCDCLIKHSAFSLSMPIRYHEFSKSATFQPGYSTNSTTKDRRVTYHLLFHSHFLNLHSNVLPLSVSHAWLRLCNQTVVPKVGLWRCWRISAGVLCTLMNLLPDTAPTLTELLLQDYQCDSQQLMTSYISPCFLAWVSTLYRFFF